MREGREDHPKKEVTSVSYGSLNTDFFSHLKVFCSPELCLFPC